MFRRTLLHLAAEKLERQHRARISDARSGREAVQEVKARRELGYPPLVRLKAPRLVEQPDALTHEGTS